jgi:hypothetical protein
MNNIQNKYKNNTKYKILLHYYLGMRRSATNIKHENLVPNEPPTERLFGKGRGDVMPSILTSHQYFSPT